MSLNEIVGEQNIDTKPDIEAAIHNNIIKKF